MKKYKDWQIANFAAVLFLILFILSMMFFDGEGALFFIVVAFVAYFVGIMNYKIDR